MQQKHDTKNTENLCWVLLNNAQPGTLVTNGYRWEVNLDPFSTSKILTVRGDDISKNLSPSLWYLIHVHDYVLYYLKPNNPTITIPKEIS